MTQTRGKIDVYGTRVGFETLVDVAGRCTGEGARQREVFLHTGMDATGTPVTADCTGSDALYTEA